MFLQRPLFGWGPWSVFHFHGLELARFRSEYIYAHVHNLPINVLAESGLLGFTGLLTMVVSLLLEVFRSRKPMLAVLLTSLIVANLYDYYFWVPATAVIVGIMWLHVDEERLEWDWRLATIASMAVLVFWALALFEDFGAVLY